MSRSKVTSEFRKLLDESGTKYEPNGEETLVRLDGKTYRIWAYDNERLAMSIAYLTPEQAIAATLGSRLNPDGLPVGLTASDDGNQLNWRGENYVKQNTFESGTLTAEQVWMAVNPRSVCVPEKGDKEWQAIADELNARAERTCKIIEWYEARDKHERGNNRVRFSCGDFGTCHNKFCPECGAKVVE